MSRKEPTPVDKDYVKPQPPPAPPRVQDQYKVGMVSAPRPYRKFVITNPERPCPCGPVYDIRIPDQHRWVSVSLACPGCGESPLWWDDAECLTDTGPDACGHLHCHACDLKWIGHES